MALGLGLMVSQPMQASAQDYTSNFDAVLGTELRAPRDFQQKYANPLEAQVARYADGSKGRIGVAAVDLSSGREIAILGDQRFPMASTSKVAIAATFLDGVDKGKWSLSSEFPLLVAVASPRFSSAIAPVRKSTYMSASQLIDLMITRSSNPATDALLAAIGGPAAVNRWMRNAGINDFRIDRDIATLVRDDGEFDPASHIDQRDSATPRAMVQLLSGLHQGRWLSASSRRVIMSAMERCVTGKRRIPALLPVGVQVAHKTGSLNNTSSDIGIISGPDGRTYAVAIYVTGQGTRLAREERIAQIARAIYDGYSTNPANDSKSWVNARY
ncbi:putative beta-lactamase [Caenibius tardaugens NBRC 16725]|uniref:Beta-lactamase n=1 Tax=Caenibius tardaugens NBRC 16725 TaxID=1219035 RepID=U2ZQ63_9SPHN|nr:class A beta-lactamase [Caenibius tardaugens NBRC 16725]GAD47509.1 putative beta-lactamase [Caenibius tardaugens NBRC 16725]